MLARRDVMEIRSADERTVARQSGSVSSRPHSSGLFAALFMAVILLALIMSSRPADAVDELYLTGTIKSVNAATGIVTVDVVSSSCSGMRVFKTDRLDKLEEYIDARVSFFIDSSKCNVKETYTILTARGLRK